MQVIAGHASLGAPAQFDALAHHPLHHLVLHVARGALLAGNLVPAATLVLEGRGLRVRSVVVHQDLPGEGVRGAECDEHHQESSRAHGDGFRDSATNGKGTNI